MPDLLKYRHLRDVPPDLCERALRASGMRRGNTIPGTIILKDALGPGWKLGECHQLMCDLQDLATHLCSYAVKHGLRRHTYWMMYKINMGQIVFESHHGRYAGPCQCLWHRIWRLQLEEIGEALSEY